MKPKKSITTKINNKDKQNKKTQTKKTNEIKPKARTNSLMDNCNKIIAYADSQEIPIEHFLYCCVRAIYFAINAQPELFNGINNMDNILITEYEKKCN